jgi:TonB family protein
VVDLDRHSSPHAGMAMVPRAIAASAALCVNILLVAALMTPSRGADAGLRPDPAEPIVVYFVDTALKVHKNLATPRPHRFVAAPGPRAMLAVRHAAGPPTETPASIAQRLLPDGVGEVVDAAAVRETCQRSRPGFFTSEVAEGAEMVLRIFVTPDGRIGQGTVIGSSGDEVLDRTTLQCLQAYARLHPAPDTESATGSWRRLAWHWSQP